MRGDKNAQYTIACMDIRITIFFQRCDSPAVYPAHDPFASGKEAARHKGSTYLSIYTVCPRSSDPFYRVSYYINWVTTSWSHSTDLSKQLLIYGEDEVRPFFIHSLFISFV